MGININISVQLNILQSEFIPFQDRMLAGHSLLYPAVSGVLILCCFIYHDLPGPLHIAEWHLHQKELSSFSVGKTRIAGTASTKSEITLRTRLVRLDIATELGFNGMTQGLIHAIVKSLSFCQSLVHYQIARI